MAGSLADGRYTLKIKATKIRNDAGLSLSGNVVDAFFRRFGDADGDNDVDATDGALFDSAFGTRQGDAAFQAFFDYNGDGVLDARDRRQLNRSAALSAVSRRSCERARGKTSGRRCASPATASSA